MGIEDNNLRPVYPSYDAYLARPRSDSDGLHVAAAFYEAGGEDTRKRVALHDVELAFVLEGDEQTAKDFAQLVAEWFLLRDDVTSGHFTVTPR